MPKSSPWVTFWVVLCAMLNCAGWILSVFHQLNRLGYCVALLVIALGFFFWIKNQPGERYAASKSLKKFPRRFRRAFPLAFLTLAILAFIGGALYPPTNYDALAYRVPRMLNWLAEGRWHWIETDFQRVNVRATGFEWVSMPFLAMFHSDRGFFLVNIVSLLLLPGLVFSVFTRLGMKPRAAWYWMWLLPTGYCFVLQAGSIGNDMFSAVFALAALDFALRARASMQIREVWLACLAGALLSGGKTSNFPLLLPIGIALLPSLRLLKQRVLGTVAVAVIAAWVSFLPMAILNFKNCGDWSGQKAEQAFYGQGDAIFHTAHNCVLVVFQNLIPPIFPLADKWNQTMLKVIPTNLQRRLESSFEPGGAHIAADQMQIEEAAGLGMGVSVLILAAFFGTMFSKHIVESTQDRKSRLFRNTILAAAVVSIFPFLYVSGSTTAARLVTPYYGLIVPIFLLRQSGDWIKRNAWWRWIAGLVFLMAALLIVLSPPRPLWPAQTVLSKFDLEKHPLARRAQTVYSVYGQRADAFAPAREQLPADANEVGFISFDDPETSLWLPFGHRRVVHIRIRNAAGQMKRMGVRYILVSSELISQRTGKPIEAWLEDNHFEFIRMIPMTLRASSGPRDWALAKLREDR